MLGYVEIGKRKGARLITGGCKLGGGLHVDGFLYQKAVTINGD